MKNGLSKEWIKKAEEDYLAAVTLSKKRGKATPDVVCFLAQQCAEKYLKAFLTAHKQEFKKTHMLTILLQQCIAIESGFELIRDLVVRLNPYAVEFRYPGEEARKRESRLAMDAAKEIRTFVRAKI